VLVATGCAFALLAAHQAVAPPAKQSSGTLRLEKLSDGLYVYRGLVSNSGVLVLKTGVLVVDTQVSERAARRLREQIRTVTPLPVKWVVVTHYHLDHCGGNAFFAAEGAQVIASNQTRQLLAERADEAAAWARAFSLPLPAPPQPCAAPSQTFTGRFTMTLDGEQVRLLQLGATETPDGLAVWLPRRRVLFAGDAVSGWDYPFTGVPTADDGLHDDGAWTGFLREAGELKPEILVPGHGSALEGEVEAGRRIQQLYDLFEITLAVTRREVARGTPFPELLVRVRDHVDGFRRRDGFDQTWVGQDFAIFRVWNSVLRRGRGWWSDLGPRTLPSADPRRVADEERRATNDLHATLARAMELAAAERSIALALLDAKLSQGPPLDRTQRAALLGAKAALSFGALREARPLQGATAWLFAAQSAAREALALDPSEPTALFAQGGSQLVAAMIFGLPLGPPEELVRAALRGGLPEEPAREAHFLLGKAAFLEDRRADEDRELRAALPPYLRWAYPLVREKLERFP
jgi:glyoxylase-like metal-dependent hydrolase (beta-lactamase superfamily II)